MAALARIHDLFRRKALTDDDLRAREEAKLAKGRLRMLKASQTSGYVGEVDTSQRGGRY